MKCYTLIAILATVLSLPGVASATLIFSAVGNDLDVTFTDAVSFAVNANTAANEFGIVLEDAFNFSQPNNFAFHTGDAPMTLNAALTSILGNNAGTISSAIGAVDPTDLFIFWNFGFTQALTIGDTVTVGLGTRTIPNFISNGGVVPDTGAFSLELTLLDGGSPISTPVSVSTAVPEPTTLALLCLSLAGLGITRRRLRV